MIWTTWLALLVGWTGIVFPFNLAFIEFGIPTQELAPWYMYFELYVLDVCFWIDLGINFIFTYRDGRGRQVYDLRRIAIRYLKTYFFINLIACIPPEVFSYAVCAVTGTSPCTSSSVNQVGRLSRLQRFTRMARLTRLTRLGKLAAFVHESRVYKKLQGVRGVRVVNQCAGLLLVAHLVACGWWLVASFHEDRSVTWLDRRPVGNGGETLLSKSELGEYPAWKQWLTTLYFTLTVFTTVGFGDMSAFSLAEMVYACTAMIVGCIVNGIILSQVITILTTVNEDARAAEEKETMIRKFGTHMQVPNAFTQEMIHRLTGQKLDATFDRNEIKEIVASGVLPMTYLSILPHALFGGRLAKNSFVRYDDKHGDWEVPPRFPIYLGLACKSFFFDAGQYVYDANDHAWNLYLVMDGTFAYVARPGETHEITSEISKNLIWNVSKSSVRSVERNRQSPYQLFGLGNYFGDIEIILETCPRISSARCESQEGSLLVLHKRDLFDLLEEFPLMRSRWRDHAARRARHRFALFKRMDHDCDHKGLAARLIQQNYRMIVDRRRNPPPAVAYDLGNKATERSVYGWKHQLPSEVVPMYARSMQGAIEDLRQEMQDLRQDLKAEIKKVKESHVRILRTPRPAVLN